MTAALLPAVTSSSDIMGVGFLPATRPTKVVNQLCARTSTVGVGQFRAFDMDGKIADNALIRNGAAVADRTGQKRSRAHRHPIP